MEGDTTVTLDILDGGVVHDDVRLSGLGEFERGARAGRRVAIEPVDDGNNVRDDGVDES